MNYILETKSLSKSYGHFKALNDINMHVSKGDIYGFIGKNGAGKTTLIRIICGLQHATSGEYTLYSRNSNKKAITKSRRRMGAVVETPSIYLDMSAKENLEQQFTILGIPSFKDIPEILHLVGLENTGSKKAKNFSLGMRQRLGIAIALAGNPDFLILDEPTNGLDPQGIIEIRELILKLNREHQISFLISSHILDELFKIATHYGFIDQGRIIKEMSASQLHSACRKCTRVEVSNTSVLAHILDEMNIDYEILSEGHVDIFAKMNISSLVKALMNEDCELFTITEHDESLESYFVSLVGGESHA